MGNPLIREDGNRYGLLTVLGYAGIPGNVSKWLCRCDCGKERVFKGLSLRSGKALSCGCLQGEKHGMHGTPEYLAWRSMKGRCNCPKNKHYHHYGGRGIKICDRWQNSFANFYADMGPRPSPRHTLDRINNDGDYCPENCRWATMKEQCRNRRNNVVIELDGERLLLKEWSERTGLCSRTITSRIKCGWSVRDALTVPARSKSQKQKTD